jgi:hypothetical protein
VVEASAALDNLQVETRPEVIVAALLYLITAYRGNRCPCLASCIARHFDCLARHPRADRVLRDIAAASIREWTAAAVEAPEGAAKKPSFLRFALH